MTPTAPDCPTLPVGDDSPRLAAFLRIVLQAVDPDVGLPAKHRLDIKQLGRAGVLPYIYIVEHCADDVLRFGLSGEEVRWIFGFALRGKTVAEVLGREHGAMVDGIYRRTLRNRELVHSTGPVYRGGKLLYKAERLIVPACDTAGEVRFILCCFQRQEADRLPARGAEIRFDIGSEITIPVDRLASVAP